jgi:hypothetical protein
VSEELLTEIFRTPKRGLTVFPGGHGFRVDFRAARSRRMKKMWIQLKPDCDLKRLELESGIKMSCFRLSEDFIHYFKDFDMVRS